jgi:hypothetical protein
MTQRLERLTWQRLCADPGEAPNVCFFSLGRRMGDVHGARCSWRICFIFSAKRAICGPPKRDFFRQDDSVGVTLLT